MPDMDEIIRRIRRDMDTELRKRARRALDGPAGWSVSGEAGPDGGGDAPATAGNTGVSAGE
ncbi:hypothetical protein [Streptomyces griseocarneus]|uniref:hypothetical protein n=1 Tax=Streptomyces griseocarneus TaxID=51201 RepID=UPI00167F1BD0|nr:hypothetical protein [Streptomyces griseocarneus]MBZ6477563.1 hypothetical protein [Streptomyces griseocarneus]GHG82474.1 hypothetical protein GCM10018779_65170 [Streptomyces griseocarneus]